MLNQTVHDFAGNNSYNAINHGIIRELPRITPNLYECDFCLNLIQCKTIVNILILARIFNQKLQESLIKGVFCLTPRKGKASILSSNQFEDQELSE
jgi:hypothetical protein